MFKMDTFDGKIGRHTLLDISDAERERILEKLLSERPEKESRLYERLLIPQRTGARIPGIVRRADGQTRPEDIPVGFSAHMCGPEGRPRLATVVHRKDVVHVTSPYDLLPDTLPSPRNACIKALADCRDHATAEGLELGVWGSAALELYTGLSYTHDGSDLDLLITEAPLETLNLFLSQIKKVEARYGLRIDTEVELSNGYGVHLKELLGTGRSVLGKGRNDVVLLPREETLAALPVDKCKIVSSKHVGGPCE